VEGTIATLSGARFVVGGDASGDPVGGTKNAHLVKQLDGNGVRQLEAAGPRTRALDEVEAKLAKHLAVPGRQEIDRQLAIGAAPQR
jgi:hypothetical protein